MSEHDAHEDELGRLSMWRAYGGVAMVLNSTPFQTVSDALGVYSNPVTYQGKEAFADRLCSVARMIEDNSDFLRYQDRHLVFHHVLWMMRAAILCTKHPGFAEEREWRIFYCPSQTTSSKLVESIEVVRGTAQKVYKLPLKDYPEEGFVGASVPLLIDHIIIGPTQFPYVTYDAFVRLLMDAGVPNAQEKVMVSSIPLRR